VVRVNAGSLRGNKKGENGKPILCERFLRLRFFSRFFLQPGTYCVIVYTFRFLKTYSNS